MVKAKAKDGKEREENQMKYDDNQRHEHNVTAELYRQLKNRGHNVHMSYRAQGAEFDLVLIQDNEIKAIFEVKNSKKAYKSAGAQVGRYLQYGIPIVLVVTEGVINRAVEAAEGILRGDAVEAVTRLIPTA